VRSGSKRRVAAADDRPGASTAPNLDDALPPFAPGPDDALEDASDVEIAGAQWTGARVEALQLSRVRFVRVNLADSRLPRLFATDVVFEECNLSNVAIDDGSFDRVSFTGCKLSGLQLTQANLYDVELRECRLDLAAFYRAKLKRVSFLDCQLHDGDYAETTLDRVLFADCDLTGASFARMRVEGSEMRGCTLARLRGVAELRGMAMGSPDVAANAELFAAALGIRTAAAD
jgi:uncharacterized protein YjbI with pentapeptide repeats